MNDEEALKSWNLVLKFSVKAQDYIMFAKAQVNIACLYKARSNNDPEIINTALLHLYEAINTRYYDIVIHRCD